jgi:phosphatidylinositol alpha-1,6-mannosyltransferase
VTAHKPIKLLLVTNAYPPPLEGGHMVFLHNLVSNCPASDVIVYANTRSSEVSFDTKEKYRIIRSHFKYSNMSKLEQARMTLETFAILVPLLRKEPIDILLAGSIFNEGIIFWVLGKIFKKPYILFGYGEEFNLLLHRSHTLTGWLKKKIYCFLIKNAKGLISVSDYTSSLFQAFGADARKICKIVPMVSPSKQVASETVEATKVKFNLSNNQRIILSVGRLIERKGQSDLIRSIPYVQSAFPNTILIIVGRGADNDKLHKLVDDLGLHSFVVFFGFTEDDELAALYELCDVFALPHRELEYGDTEGCPTVFLEANAHGKPVVGGNAGGVQDAIWDGVTGFIVDGKKPEQIATALIKLLADRQLAEQMGARGRQRVMEDLTPQRGAELLLAFCHKILDKGLIT